MKEWTSVRRESPRTGTRVSPVVTWGVSIGVLIALVDLVSVLVSRNFPADGDVAQYIGLADQLANVVMYSFVGLRVGREAGMVRSAAEAGVLAGVIAGAAAILTSFVLPDAAFASNATRQIIGILAFNIAMGGVLAWVNGWLTRRRPATPSGPRR